MTSFTLNGLEKRYDQSVVVKNLQLQAAHGEFISLLGPSGCGKTTTLRCLAGLEKPSAGRILFGDQDVTSLPAERRNIGMVFQNYALFPHMTVTENIRFGLEMRKQDKGDQGVRVKSVLDMVQLSGMEERFPRHLSGGQQQRVALARALVFEPTLLLLDEPLANLDAKLRDEMRYFIRSLQQRLGITTVYVTHDQVEAMTMSDRIVVMFNGEIHQMASPEDLYFRPATREVATFIGRANLLDATLVRAGRDGAVLETPVGMIGCQALAGDRSIGATGTVLIRPESISFDTNAAGNGRAGVPGIIRSRQFLGNSFECEVSVKGDTMLTVHCSSHVTTPHVGSDVSLVIDDSQTWFIESDNE